MPEPNREIITKGIIEEFPISENITPKEAILDKGFYNMGNSVEDQSTLDKTEKVVLQGTEEATIHPSEKPFILRSGARCGCDASLLLEVAEDGTAHAAVTHWEPTEKAHTNKVTELTEQPIRGTRFAVLVSGTIKDLQEAEGTDLYQKMTDWNNGRKPDLVYIPFEGIEWSKIARATLYQLVLTTRSKNSEPQFEIKVPGTIYTKTFTPQSLQEAITQETTFVSLNMDGPQI